MNHFWKLHKKKRQQKQLEREKQGFVPTGFPPTPVSSPKKGAKAVCSSFTATKAYLKQTLKAEADKMNGLEPKKPRPPRCHYCLRDSHLPNNCWSVDPWRCPEWFLRKWIKNVRPTPREPSRATLQSWGRGIGLKTYSMKYCITSFITWSLFWRKGLNWELHVKPSYVKMISWTQFLTT